MHATDRRDFHIAHRNKVVVGDTELGEEMGQIIKHLIFQTLRTREERNAFEDRVKCGGEESQPPSPSLLRAKEVRRKK